MSQNMDYARTSLVSQIVKNLPAMRDASVFLPGEFHGQKSLAGYSPWDQKESETTEATNTYLLVDYAIK